MAPHTSNTSLTICSIFFKSYFIETSKEDYNLVLQNVIANHTKIKKDKQKKVKDVL